MSVPAAARVAVVIPVFHASYLVEALESVFAQTRLPDEVIVVDDGSPQREQVGAAAARWAGRVNLIRQANAGAGAARNQGIRATTADRIAFLDADDWWTPRHLETQTRELDRHPDCGLVYANAVYEGDTPLAGRHFLDLCPSLDPVTATSLLALRCHIPLSTVVARRPVLMASGLFDDTLRRGQDFDLWLRLAMDGVQFRRHPAVLMHHRVHDHNLSGSRALQMQRAAGVFRKALATLPLTPEQRTIASQQVRRFEAAIALEQGKALLSRGDYSAARAAFERTRGSLRGWKVAAALLGLRFAPHLVRHAYLASLRRTPPASRGATA